VIAVLFGYWQKNAVAAIFIFGLLLFVEKLARAILHSKQSIREPEPEQCQPEEDHGQFIIASHSTPHPKWLEKKEREDSKPLRSANVQPWTAEELRTARLTGVKPERFQEKD
jgi:hypothetical protein